MKQQKEGSTKFLLAGPHDNPEKTYNPINKNISPRALDVKDGIEFDRDSSPGFRFILIVEKESKELILHGQIDKPWIHAVHRCRGHCKFCDIILYEGESMQAYYFKVRKHIKEHHFKYFKILFKK